MEIEIICGRIDDALKSAAEVRLFRGGFGGFPWKIPRNKWVWGVGKFSDMSNNGEICQKVLRPMRAYK